MPVTNKREPEIVQYLNPLTAVALEVCGTMLLPVSQNFTCPVPTLSLIGCYAASFYCLFLLLDLRPEYAADRGGLPHLAWARDFSHHLGRLSSV